MLNLEGKTIIYLTDVGSPPSQAGKMGETRVLSRASNFAANTLLRGGRVRVIEPSEAHAVRVEIGLEKPKPERRKPSVGRINGRGYQESDSGKKESAGANGTGGAARR